MKSKKQKLIDVSNSSFKTYTRYSEIDDEKKRSCVFNGIFEYFVGEGHSLFDILKGGLLNKCFKTQI